MSVVITPASHPHLSSFFTLVSSSMGIDIIDQFVDVNIAEISRYEDQIAQWSVADFIIMAGVVDDIDRFNELLVTEVGLFVNSILTFY